MKAKDQTTKLTTAAKWLFAVDSIYVFGSWAYALIIRHDRDPMPLTFSICLVEFSPSAVLSFF
jgi:hypothetical protein